MIKVYKLYLVVVNMVRRYVVDVDDDDDLFLDDDQNNVPQGRGFWFKFKLYLLLIIVIIIYLVYNDVLLWFIDILKSNPTLFDWYLYIESQIQNSTYKGLILLSFLGSLFFLALPSEALFIYYISSTYKSLLLVFLIIVAGNMLGLIFNYMFGRLLGERVTGLIFRKKLDKYQDRIDRYGGFLLFFGNILPGPIEVIVLFFGAFKYNFKKYLILCLAGRAIKYIILAILFFTFWDQLIFLYEDTIESFFNI